jgi:hypothetical protein
MTINAVSRFACLLLLSACARPTIATLPKPSNVTELIRNIENSVKYDLLLSPEFYQGKNLLRIFGAGRDTTSVPPEVKWCENARGFCEIPPGALLQARFQTVHDTISDFKTDFGVRRIDDPKASTFMVVRQIAGGRIIGAGGALYFGSAPDDFASGDMVPTFEKLLPDLVDGCGEDVKREVPGTNLFIACTFHKSTNRKSVILRFVASTHKLYMVEFDDAIP